MFSSSVIIFSVLKKVRWSIYSFLYKRKCNWIYHKIFELWIPDLARQAEEFICSDRLYTYLRFTSI